MGPRPMRLERAGLTHPRFGGHGERLGTAQASGAGGFENFGSIGQQVRRWNSAVPGEKYDGLAGGGADTKIASGRDGALGIVENANPDATIAVATPDQIGGSIGGFAVDDKNLEKLRRIVLLEELIDEPRKHLALVPHGENQGKVRQHETSSFYIPDCFFDGRL